MFAKLKKQNKWAIFSALDIDDAAQRFCGLNERDVKKCLLAVKMARKHVLLVIAIAVVFLSNLHSVFFSSLCLTAGATADISKACTQRKFSRQF